MRVWGVLYLIYLRQIADFRPMQHAQRQAHHLQVFAARRGADVARLRPDIKRYRLLQPGHQEVRAFVDDLVGDSSQAVEDDGACAAFDVVDGGAGEGEADGGGDGVAVDLVECVRHVGGRRGGRWVGVWW